MEIRGRGGRGPLLFKWDPNKQILCIVHKGVCYKVRFEANLFYVVEESRKKLR